MDFATFYKSLSHEDRDAFASRAGRSRRYIEIHLITRRKQPTKATMRSLADASNGAVDYQSMLNFFYGDDAKAAS